jgi:hypothetical protein
VLLESVYEYLISQGHAATAKSLLKEAKLDEKTVKAAKVEKLTTIFSSYKRPAEAAAVGSSAAKKAKKESKHKKKTEEEARAAKANREHGLEHMCKASVGNQNMCRCGPSLCAGQC